MDVGKDQTAAEVSAVLASGIAFAFVNSTTGLHSVSSAFTTNRDLVHAATTVLTGFYHWACPYNSDATTPNHSDPLGEASWFLTTVAPKAGDLLALDLEQSDASDWPTRVAYAVAWLQKVADDTKARPLIYLNWNWIQNMRTVATAAQWAVLTSFPLWLAEPTGVPGQHSTVTSQDKTSEDCWPILIHQYGTVDGIDRNYTPDVAALAKCGVPA